MRRVTSRTNQSSHLEAPAVPVDLIKWPVSTFDFYQLPCDRRYASKCVSLALVIEDALDPLSLFIDRHSANRHSD